MTISEIIFVLRDLVDLPVYFRISDGKDELTLISWNHSLSWRVSTIYGFITR